MDRLDLENIEYCNDLAKRINRLASDIQLALKEIINIKAKLDEKSNRRQTI